MKCCLICGEYKDESKFNNNKYSKDNKHNICRGCDTVPKHANLGIPRAYSRLIVAVLARAIELLRKKPEKLDMLKEYIWVDNSFWVRAADELDLLNTTKYKREYKQIIKKYYD